MRLQPTRQPGLVLLAATLFGTPLACSSTSITPRDDETGGSAGRLAGNAGGTDEGGGPGTGNGEAGSEAMGGTAGTMAGSSGTAGAVVMTASGGSNVGGAEPGGAAGTGGAPPNGGATPGGAPTAGAAGNGETALDGGAGGSVGGTGGIGGTTGSGGDGGLAGTGGTDGCLPADDPLVQGLHGCVEDLGEGRVRVSYDFEDADQLLDWRAPVDSIPAPTIDDQDRLLVATGSNPNVAMFGHQMRVDALDYRVRLISGDHVNVYVDTVWDGGWAPDLGIGCIHNTDGLGVVVDAIWDTSPTTFSVHAGDRYVGSLVVTDTQLTWTVNDIEHVRTYDARTRSTLPDVAIGAYYSDVAFESVVLEGELAEP